jgi:hypothetical protein
MMRPFVLACIERAGDGGFEPPPPELLDTYNTPHNLDQQLR